MALRRRPDEDQALVEHRLREILALGQKAIAGVDRVRAGALGGFENLVDLEVAFARRRRPDVDRFVGVADVQAGAVSIRIHGDGRDAQFAAGADDAHGDLAAIGDQHFLDLSLRLFNHQSYLVCSLLDSRGGDKGLPCFLGGLLSRLFWSTSSPLIRRARVSRGSITSSM